MASHRSSPKKRRSPRCGACGRTIRVPAGWSQGAAVRKHYWRNHPEVMRATRAAR
ncbi:MAG TPA: hypothetical protein VFS18_04175 [Actinomycetota bacterium]|nr:hypothetical protein [Actinomycetota bacterium]